MKNWFVIILLPTLLLSCGISMGDRIDNGNLSVYFLEGIPKEKAISFARYWRNNGFVGERKQIIQLESDKDVVIVKIIEREMYHEDLLNITEEALIQQLERDLKTKVFDLDTEILITDNTFRPILKR
ncbi:MAG TPA: hypothetical protein VKY37_06445 [Brumimicrobium sp.]|nr:hypothetical protein [Brumimicrobium sp.]